jgi:hypothetical protein
MNIKSLAEIKIFSKPILFLFLPIFFVSLFKCFGPFSVDNELFFGNIGINQDGSIVGRTNEYGHPSIDPSTLQITLGNGHTASKIVLDGNLPLWNHFNGLGQPLLAEMQSAALFPPTWLLSFPYGQIIMQLILQFFGGIGTFLFLKKIGLGKTASIFGGLLFEFNGVFTWLQNTCFNPIAFLPWILYSIEGIYQSIISQKKITKYFVNKYVICGSISSSLAIYSGFPEIVFLYTLFIIFWIILRNWNLNIKDKIYFIKHILLMAFISFLLSIPLIYVFFEFLSIAHTGGHSGSGFSGSFLDSRALIQYIFPYIYGPIFGIPNPKIFSIWGSIGGYIGFFPFILSILSLLNKNNRSIKLLLLFWIIFTLSATHGLDIANKILYSIPFLKLISASRYIDITWIFAFIILASFYINESIDKYETFNKKIVFIIIISLLSITAVFAIFNFELIKQYFITLKSYKHLLSWTIINIFLIVFLSILFYLMTRYLKLIKRKVIFLVCFIEVVILYLAPVSAFPTSAYKDMSLINFFRDNIGYNRFVTVPGEQDAIASGLAQIYDISQLNYADIPTPLMTHQYIKKNLDPYAANLYLPDFPTNIDIDNRRRIFFNNLDKYGLAGVKYYVGLKEKFDTFKPYNYANSFALKRLDLKSNQSITTEFIIPKKKYNNNIKIESINIRHELFSRSADGNVKISICANLVKCKDFLINIQDTKIDINNLVIDLKNFNIGQKDNNKIKITIERISGKSNYGLYLSAINEDQENKNINNSKVIYKPLIHVNLSNEFDNEYQSLVFENNRFYVFEIKNFTDYFSAPGCQITPTNRNSLITDCNQDSVLNRLELNMPGWITTINGNQVKIEEVGEVFQKINLSKGKSNIKFDYRPKYFDYAIILFFLGLLGIIYLFLRNFRKNKKA